jgi:hypothetical protein
MMRYVRSRRMGYRATKKEEKTPATMDSQVTRTLERMVAKRRLRVATRAAERVEPEMFSFWRMQEKMMARGVMPMRASW